MISGWEQELKKRIVECEKDEKAAQQKLAEIQAELLRLRRALAAGRGDAFIEPKTGKRFADFRGRPIEAMKILLEENADEMKQSDLTKLMIDEGVFDRTVGEGERATRSPESRASLTYKINEKLGNIRRKGGMVYLIKKPK